MNSTLDNFFMNQRPQFSEFHTLQSIKYRCFFGTYTKAHFLKWVCTESYLDSGQAHEKPIGVYGKKEGMNFFA